VAGVRSDEKLWIVLVHLSVFMGVGLLLPLIVYLVKKDESPAVRHHAAQALNFHISLVLYGLACIPLTFVLIGIPLLLALSAATLVFAIIAAVKGANGEAYRYPIALPFVKST
jgi:hypothetical protein